MRHPFRDLVYRVNRVLTVGQEVWVRVSGMPRIDEQGKFCGYRGTGAHVTEEVRAQQRARTAEALLANALHSMSDGLALFDRDGRLLVCNETYRRIQGREVSTRADAGATFEQLLRAQVDSGHFLLPTGDVEPWIQRRLAGFRNGGQVFEIESLSDGYALFDAEDRLVVWNSMWLALATPETRGIIRRGVQFEETVRCNVESGRFIAAGENPQRWIADRLRRHRECGAPFEIEFDDGRCAHDATSTTSRSKARHTTGSS